MPSCYIETVAMEPAGDWHSQAERAYTLVNWSDPSGCTTVLEMTQLSKEVVGMPAAKVLPDKEEAITKINTRLFEQAMVHFKKHKGKHNLICSPSFSVLVPSSLLQRR